MLNKCLLRKTKRQRLILEPPPSLSQSPQSIKAALLSKSLGPKGNQTQQLQLCLPGPVPPPRPGLGFSCWGPPLPCLCGRGKNAGAVTWPWTFPQPPIRTKAFLLPQQSKRHPAQRTLPTGSPQNWGDPCRIIHLPVFADSYHHWAVGKKKKEKFVLNIYDSGGVLIHRAEFLHKAGEIQSSVKCAW